MKLSILIPVVPNHKNQCAALLLSLMRQLPDILTNKNEKIGECLIDRYTFPEVEIIVALDDKKITTGAKRNLLLSLAVGDYVAFIDADDYVYQCYVLEILKGIETGCDIMATNGIMTTDGMGELKWKLSKNYPNQTIYENGKQIYIRKANHLSPVKRELALKAGFSDVSNGEDKYYSERLNPYLNKEHVIDPCLYHYRYISTNKEYK